MLYVFCYKRSEAIWPILIFFAYSSLREYKCQVIKNNVATLLTLDVADVAKWRY